MTPEGFFASSSRDTDMLALVRGMQAVTIGQVHQSLFNPDLVRESLVDIPMARSSVRRKRLTSIRC